MTKEEVQELYKKKILPESKNAYHFEKKDDAGIVIEAYNPMCGDKYKIYLYEKNGIIDNAFFHGFGCAVSKASTSVLTRKLEGMSALKAVELASDFLSSLENNDPNINDEQLNILRELINFEGRKDCIELSWKAVQKELT